MKTAWTLCAILAAAVAWAADPPAPPTPTSVDTPPVNAASVETAAGTPDAAPAEEAVGAEESLPPLPPEQRTTAPTPQRFDPTEEVRADFPVSFPIDI
jgi:hypothetical protein